MPVARTGPFFPAQNMAHAGEVAFSLASVDTDDSGPCSLRQAVTDAINTRGADVIDFGIAGDGQRAI